MGILINAVVLYLLVSVFTDSMESSLRWKVLAVAVAVGVFEVVASGLATGGVVTGIAILVASAAFVGVLLELFCKMPRKTAFKIAASFVAIRIVFGLTLLAWVGMSR